MTITKAEIIDVVHSRLGFPKKKSSELVETLLEIIKRTLENGDDVLISGFGKLCVNKKKERKGRNPATGEDMMLSERNVISFKCSQRLREKINNKEI
ncbi:MAG TPA: integration host factor subunit alpha [Desulfobacterales bacterium]|nr:integration host factor subunit alpha [Desulfobacterales bacterium]